jgi:hypothetical protein
LKEKSVKEAKKKKKKELTASGPLIPGSGDQILG